MEFFTSATSGGILDKAIDAEEKMHGDFLRLVMFLSCSLNVIVSVCVHTPGNFKLYFKKSDKSSSVFVGIIHAGTYRGLLGIVSQDKNLFCHCCFHVGCRILYQS